MQEINWKNFAAKFNGREQSSFEWLCYLLFCIQFNKPTGIFRYKNQAGIETQPIECDGISIGFQAKYYDTSISSNKQKIKDAIKKAKEWNPNISRILFYINREFSESTKKQQKDPMYKIEIERYASKLGIEIEWKSKSFFESLFVCHQNADIAKYFFSFDNSVIDFIGELIARTEIVLDSIHSNIHFKDSEIKIDRSQALGELRQKLSQCSVAILSGEAGVGKTALVKDLYDIVKKETPFFVFKAMEFNVSNINDLFSKYGQFTFQDFIKEYQEHSEKFIVIDSAEKLADIEYKEVFTEFLTALFKANWKLIVTTRYSYIEALEYQLTQVHRAAFQSIIIARLKPEELYDYAEKYNFILPQNNRLFELLTIPFYLNEYLRASNIFDETTSYYEFKDSLWKQQIVKIGHQVNNAHKKREECFLKIAYSVATEGHMVVDVNECDHKTLRTLDSDEIIKLDHVIGGYFITHNIYEEWALDRIIERAFRREKDHNSFLESIGTSLPIRRALRSWLSEKLFDDTDKVKGLIEEIINDKKIAGYWKDEIYISVLMSEYAGTFLELLKDRLMEDNARLLMRLVFILRTACKEIDEEFLAMLGVKKSEQDVLKIIPTKPKGTGWNSIIQFIFDNKEEVGLGNANIIIPLLDDWNKKSKIGETTKLASQIALFYYNRYDEISINGKYRYSYRDKSKEQLIGVILSGAAEISGELETIFNEVISNKLNKYGDKYYDIIVTILGYITDGIEVINVLPSHVIQLADLFWHKIPNKHYFDSLSLGVEPCFGLTGKHNFGYFPSSAFQTPIFHLLMAAPLETVNFILSFTNRAVEYYRKSELGHEVSQVKIVFDETNSYDQYISSRLWNTYRGTHVSTDLLQSIHMALEKWLLMGAKFMEKEVIESWCFYLLRKTKSSSITAVVTSICLAYPSKLFNIASILFKTKEFFFYDTERMLRDQHVRQTYSIPYGMNPENDFFVDERVKTCDDPHRKLSLEQLAFQYQVLGFEKDNDDDVKQRQDLIWKILDEYYENLPDQANETDDDKTWRLFLARMDRRKMKVQCEENNEGSILKFEPEIDSGLKQYSEKSTGYAANAVKHTSLKIWADYRFKKNPNYQDYSDYENSPELVIAETREIIEDINSGIDTFPAFNYSIPSCACCVLIRDFADKLSIQDKEFCRDTILRFASKPLLVDNYYYQIDDGVEPSVSLLPLLIKHFPETSNDIKAILLLLLLNNWTEIASFTIRGIIDYFWEINFDDAHSLFIGYLLLKPKFNEKIIKAVNRQRNVSAHTDIPLSKFIEEFSDEYKDEFEKFIDNRLTFNDLGNLSKLEISVLVHAFELLPPKTQHIDHKAFLDVLFPLCAKIICEERDDVNYYLKMRFMNKFAYFILCAPKDEITTYLRPFIEDFNDSRDMAQLFQAFVSIEDILNHYDEFWIVWNAFYNAIVEVCQKRGSRNYNNELIHNYLLAWPHWKSDIKEWHTLKERDKAFYQRISNDIGYHPSVLYSISKVLNEVGSDFINDGVIWISNILQKNPGYTSIELETNTIYYIENIVKRYILINRKKIKDTPILREHVIVILNFLFERGSTTGFLLRDDII